MARVRSVVRATSDSVMDGRSAENARRTDRPRSRDWTNSLRGATGGDAASACPFPFPASVWVSSSGAVLDMLCTSQGQCSHSARLCAMRTSPDQHQCGVGHAGGEGR